MIFLKSFLQFALPLLLLPFTLMGTPSKDSIELLTDFETPKQSPAWIAQNDGVMGGVSSGGAILADGILLFSGDLSLENNGGFAQIYSASKHSDFSNHQGVRLRVKGDGRTYQFRIASDARYRGSRIAYRSDFETSADEWTEVTLPFSEFIPSYRGRILTGPPLDLTSVREIAFLLADGTPGAFALEVDWIGLVAPD